uniref:Deoxyribonuclease 1 like 2 n=1 Tax=Anas platyrhynchos TaxID=8839 RepID=A0A8B9TUI7_ANAPL
TATLRIGAFNIQVFGDSKMSDEAPLPSLLSPQVLRRYDVVLVQEVRDSDLSAVTELMEQLNRYQQGRGWGHPAHDAAAEIDALYDVYLAVLNKWGTDHGGRLGDWDAPCPPSPTVFKWLIPDSSDTTVGKSDCAYDRIVVCGAKLKRSIVPNSATGLQFPACFPAGALAVSDHYPVEVKLMA